MNQRANFSPARRPLLNRFRLEPVIDEPANIFFDFDAAEIERLMEQLDDSFHSDAATEAGSVVISTAEVATQTGTTE